MTALRAWLAAALDARTVQFLAGVVLVGVGFDWGLAGLVLALHAALAPVIIRRGGTP